MKGTIIDAAFVLIAPLVVVGLLAILVATAEVDSPADTELQKLITIRALLSEIASSATRAPVWQAIWATIYLSVRGLFLGLCFAAVLVVVAGMWPKTAEIWMSVFNSLRAVPLTLLIPFVAFLPVSPLFVVPPGLDMHLPQRDPAYIIGFGAMLYLALGAAEGLGQRSNIREGVFIRHVGLGKLSYFWNVLLYEMRPSLLAMLRLTVLFTLVLAIVLEQLINYEGVGRLIVIRSSERWADPGGFLEAIALLYWVGLIGTLVDFGFRRLRFWLIRE